MTTLTNHSLYYKTFCPYCIKVRAALKLMCVDIALVNVGEDRAAYNTLVTEGGRGMVPCLRIEQEDGSVQWMYESDDIIEYVKKRVAK